jgi:hypothetical protein
MGEEDRIEDQDQKDIARFGRWFNALFGLPFEPGALLSLRPLNAS